MLLYDLHIHAYRGLEGLSLQDLAPFSLVVGPNNTGKSSILEAVTLLLRPQDPAAWTQVARQRDPDTRLADGIWSIFPNRGVLRLDRGRQESNQLKISDWPPTPERARERVRARELIRVREGELGMARALAEDPDAPAQQLQKAVLRLSQAMELQQKLVRETSRRRSLNAKATAHTIVQESGEESVELRVSAEAKNAPFSITVTNRVRVEQSTVQPEPTVTVTPMTHRSGRAVVELLSRAVDDGKKDLALELLRVFEPDVLGVDVSAGRRRQTVVVRHKRRGVADLASFGDGMRRAAVLALSLSRTAGGVLLIDELEAGIHPGVLAEVMTRLRIAAQQADVQIIATTHSLEAIDAVLEATEGHDDSLVAYHLFPSDREDKVRRYDRAKLARLRTMGLDLR